MLSSLRLQNFRSYKDSSFDFGSGVNIIIGSNGSGKTNLLEAIYLFGHSSSFRAGDDSLIRHRADWARLDVGIGKDVFTLKLQANEPSPRKIFAKNDKRVSRILLPMVLFEPDQLRIVHGPPELRRAWLDSLLSRLQPDYENTLRSYQRALRQRNRLLQQSSNADDLFVWEIKLCEYGALLAEKRKELITWLDERLGPLYGSLVGTNDKAAISYHTALGEEYGSELMQQLARKRDHDRLRGHTTVGPHRDDMAILFKAAPVADIASRGERRTLFLALKFLEAERLEDALGQKPTLLLDDLFGELDDRRKRFLQQALGSHQIIITSTDDHPIAGSLPASKRVIHLR